jgi:hypothetical protein
MDAPYLQDRPDAIVDTECYPNFWCIGFRNYVAGHYAVYERTPDHELDRGRVAALFRKYRIFTFNGIKYDLPMISLAITGASNRQLQEANDLIIEGGMSWWQFYDHYGLALPTWLDHVDLMEVSPAAASRLSLKLYSGRLHSRTMRDLPFVPGVSLTPEKIAVIRDEYLPNDLNVTADLRRELDAHLQIRVEMSRRYSMDLRSKSDPQIAEAVIKQAVEKKLGQKLYKPDIRPYHFRYEPPEFIEFQTKPLQALFERIIESDFTVKYDGYVMMPEYLKAPVAIGGEAYQMGLGGLHSVEKSVWHESTDEVEVIDRDVRSYYPNLIIQSGHAPRVMGVHFQPVYRGIVREREHAKAAGDKPRAEGGKLMSNGTFGKLGSPLSVLYAPEMLIHTTIGGQLSILMLIEALSLADFHVVSANTDGVVTLVPRAREGEFGAIVFDWECATSLITEETRYRGLYSRDVNSYVATYVDDKTGELKIKTKGMFAESGPGLPAAMGLKKAPDAQICSDAAVAFLAHGVMPEDTIEACTDVRQFVVVYRVAGGCSDNEGNYLGKAVRWYYSTQVRQPLREIGTEKTVAASMGAKPIMTLPDDFALPDDLDVVWYVREAYARIADTGYPIDDPALRGRQGTVIGRLETQKTYHLIDAASGVAACGRARPSMRDRWIEVRCFPSAAKLCTRCRAEIDL